MATTEELLAEVQASQEKQLKLIERILDEVEKIKRNTLKEE